MDGCEGVKRCLGTGVSGQPSSTKDLASVLEYRLKGRKISQRKGDLELRRTFINGGGGVEKRIQRCLESMNAVEYDRESYRGRLLRKLL